MGLRQRIYLTEAKKVSKAERTALIQAYAKKLYSAKQNAPFRIQQRFENAFNKKHRSLVGKYPHYDFESDDFWNGLRKAAESWWESSAMRGTGVDW